MWRFWLVGWFYLCSNREGITFCRRERDRERCCVCWLGLGLCVCVCVWCCSATHILCAYVRGGHTYLHTGIKEWTWRRAVINVLPSPQLFFSPLCHSHEHFPSPRHQRYTHTYTRSPAWNAPSNVCPFFQQRFSKAAEVLGCEAEIKTESALCSQGLQNISLLTKDWCNSAERSRAERYFVLGQKCYQRDNCQIFSVVRI